MEHPKDKDEEQPKKLLEFPDPNQVISYQLLVKRGRELMRQQEKPAPKHEKQQ